MLRNLFINFAVEHWFGCRATEPEYAGDIGAIDIWVPDWLNASINGCLPYSDPRPNDIMKRLSSINSNHALSDYRWTVRNPLKSQSFNIIYHFQLNRLTVIDKLMLYRTHHVWLVHCFPGPSCCLVESTNQRLCFSIVTANASALATRPTTARILICKVTKVHRFGHS